MGATTVARKRGEGKPYWMLGGLYELKASGDETNGELTVMEMTIPAGMGPPPHTHPGGESVYVLEGRIRYHVEDETLEGGPGSFFYIPEGTWERFEPVEQVRLLVIYTPGGIESFFDEAGEEADAHELPPAPEPPNQEQFEELVAIGERHGMRMKPPPEG
jgi:quercetin dioxygenase-like cupin family protein